MEIGNAWEYESGNPIFGIYPSRYERREIVADTMINATTYYIHEYRYYNEDLDLFSVQQEYIRYDEDQKAIVYVIENDVGYVEFGWPIPAACDLSADFNATITCNGRESFVGGGYTDKQIDLIPGFRILDEKGFSSPGSGFGVAFNYGIGNLQFIADYEAGYVEEFIFMRLAGIEYGASVVATSLREKMISPLLLKLRLFIPPMSEQAIVEYWLEREADIAVVLVDMLGREVYVDHLGVRLPGKQTYNLSIPQISQGVYLLRIVVGQIAVNRQFVVVK